jgi:predicted outer membrane repeat protein
VKKIDGTKDKTECEQAGGYWEASSLCFQEQPSGKRILTVNAGPVVIEGLSFQNGYSSEYGGAISGRVDINNNIFMNNSVAGYYIAGYGGGAVFGSGNISNSIFINNSADDNGGAVSKTGNITNSVFTNIAKLV